MYEIGIRLDVNDVRRIIGALGRLEYKVYYLKEDIPRKNALEFKQLLITNIVTQKYAGNYAPYNQRYREWKLKEYGDRGFWELGGHLLRSLSSIKMGDSKRVSNYFAGIPSYAYDLGGKSWLSTGGQLYGVPKNIAWYGRILEEGGVFLKSSRGKYHRQYHPARPLFFPTFNEFQRGGWITQGQLALKMLGMQWRH